MISSDTPHQSERRGIVLAGGSGTRLYPLTQAVSKQLMPVYDKPMIYYPISVLMVAGIREILIISTPEDLPNFRKLLGTGEQLGVRFEYAEQPNPEGLAQAFIIGEDFLAEKNSCLILGDNLFHGNLFSRALWSADDRTTGATIFGYHVADPKEYGVVEFDDDGLAISLEEKPEHPKSNYAVPGLYFYDNRASTFAREQKPSPRGELEITDLNRRYLEEGDLSVEILKRGTAWLDTGNPDALASATEFIRVIQSRQGFLIACLEEIAWRKGWLASDLLQKRATELAKTNYGKYLQQLLEE